MKTSLKCFVGNLAWAGVASVAITCGSWAGDGDDPHAHHHHTGMTGVRSIAEYTLPTVKLVRDDGKTVLLDEEMNDGRAVVVTFIYTTCTSICPLSSQILSQLQSKLGTARDNVHFMSISIDPEQDTPARLQDYAKKFNAGPSWQHYTGTVAASIVAQKAFDVYRGDKMSHTPVTLLRAAPGKPWVRIDGFVSADSLLSELRQFTASR